MRCLTTTAFPSRAQIQDAPFTKIGRDTVRSTFMRTSLLLAYKSVRTLRRAGLDYATPAPLASQCSWWRPRRETRLFSPRLPPPSQSHPAPEVRQDFACHTSGWPRIIRRGLLAAPRDLGGPLAGAADLVRVGEQVEERHLLFWRLLLRSRAARFRVWCVSPAEPLIAHTLKMKQEGQQKSLAGHLWAESALT